MFGMFGSDDPVRSAWQSAGMQMLLNNGDINSALQNLPQMIMEAKRFKAQQDLEKRRLAISESQLEMDRERLGIYKSESQRQQDLQNDKKKMGEAWSKYDLQPNMGGMLLPQPQGPNMPKDLTTLEDWSGDDMVTRDMKGDAAMPLGEEGNEISKRIMALPLSLRQGMAEAPISAAELAAPGQTSALESAFGKTGSERAPQVKTLTDGKQVKTLDLTDPASYAEFRDLTANGWTEAPQKTIQEASKDPNEYLMEPYKKEISSAQEGALRADAETDDYANLGSLLLRPDIYTGAGAGLVNNLLSSAQDVFGVFEGVDFSTVENADKSRRALVMNLRNSFPKDSQMSNADRQYFQDMVVGEENKPETIARAIAVKQLSGQYKTTKAEFLENAITNEGKTPYEAVKAWNKVAKKIRGDMTSEENVQEIMAELMKGANDDSLVEYVKKLKPGQAAQQAEEAVMGDDGNKEPDGTTPETAIEITGPNDWKALKPGTYYIDPEGVLRQKQ